MIRTGATKIKKSTGSVIFDTCNAVFMVLICITVLFPVWNMLVISLSRVQDITLLSMNLFPKKIVFDSYAYIFAEHKFLAALWVSVARTVLGTCYHVLVTYLAAYALTRRKMPFLKVITGLFIITMFFNGGLIPTYITMRNLRLTNNFLVYILPPAFSMYTTIIVRNYLFSLDPAMEESAVIDGANPLQVMLRIMLPLSKAVLATISLWHMVMQWNAWFDNLIYNSGSANLLTLQLLLRRIITTPEEFAIGTNMYMSAKGGDALASLNPETVKSAIVLLVILPIISVYPFFQKHFVKGIMMGSVKG